jgi:hypothetical protein
MSRPVACSLGAVAPDPDRVVEVRDDHRRIHLVEQRRLHAQLLVGFAAPGDVLVGDHRAETLPGGAADHAQLIPPTLVRSVAGVLELELRLRSGEDVAQALGGLPCGRLRGGRADVEVVEPDTVRGRAFALGEQPPGVVDGDDRAGVVDKGHVGAHRVERGLHGAHDLGLECIPGGSGRGLRHARFPRPRPLRPAGGGRTSAAGHLIAFHPALGFV